MSTEEHKALVRRFVDEFWNGGNFAVADELMVADAVIHEPAVGTPAGLKAFAREFRIAFPDWHSTVEEMIAEGDCVAERWTGKGTHLGELQGIQPTGKLVTVPGVVFYRIGGGKIVEFRGQFDSMSLMQQLGIFPGPNTLAPQGSSLDS
jgi:steroid delta-isomerase-like uncharacterized protein